MSTQCNLGTNTMESMFRSMGEAEKTTARLEQQHHEVKQYG